METVNSLAADPAAQRLASEISDVEASIALVSSGIATRVTLTGLRFGQQLAERLRAEAARQGVDLQASFWPEDTLGDIRVSRLELATSG